MDLQREIINVCDCKSEEISQTVIDCKADSATLPSITSVDTVVATVPTNMEKLLK